MQPIDWPSKTVCVIKRQVWWDVNWMNASCHAVNSVVFTFKVWTERINVTYFVQAVLQDRRCCVHVSKTETGEFHWVVQDDGALKEVQTMKKPPPATHHAERSDRNTAGHFHFLSQASPCQLISTP